MTDSFEAFLDIGSSADVSGWDFSWLNGRATEERPSWGYARQLAERLSQATASLDIQTGGGEVLSEATIFPPTGVLAPERRQSNAPPTSARSSCRGRSG